MRYLPLLLVALIVTFAATCSKKSKHSPSQGASEEVGEQPSEDIIEENEYIKVVRTADWLGPHNNQLTCMRELSVEKGQVIMRVRSSVGGNLVFQRVGDAEHTFYVPAASEIYIYTKSVDGTFRTMINDELSTKACSSL